MAQNYTRVPAKVFAGNASENLVGQFGSALAGTKVNTTDISTIQGLSAYTQGWSSAVLTNRNYPTLEEMNGVMKVMSYQTAYTMQKGVAEWDSSTTYFLGDMCKGIGTGKLYTSKVNNNIGNQLTDTIFWEEFQAGNGTVNLPATNYMSHLDGTPTYSGLTVSMPATTYNIPNGRSGDNTLNNTIQDVAATEYTINSANGTYKLFYNNNTKILHLASNYTAWAKTFPVNAGFNDVCFLLDNKMYVQETIAPNYTISEGVEVTADGTVSNLGTLIFNNATSIPDNPIFNLKFTTGEDIATAQSLFSLPYAAGIIENNSLNIAISSYAYGVNYNTQLYSGAYALIGSTTQYSYILGDITYYADSAIAVGSSIYTDEERTVLYGAVSVLTDSYITVIDTNSTELYSGDYEDTSSTVYSYTLGGNIIFSSAVLTNGLIIYSDNELSNAYGVVESITSSNLVIHSVNTSVGYVDTAGNGRVANGISIYSDIDLQNYMQDSSGLNAIYDGSTYKSAIANLNYALTASTEYEGSLIYASDAYTLNLNNIATSTVSSRVPYKDDVTIIIGGNDNFAGTFDLSSTSMPDSWSWNGKYISTLDWQEEPLCKIGEVTISGNVISNLSIDYPIELAKIADLEPLEKKTETLQNTVDILNNTTFITSGLGVGIGTTNLAGYLPNDGKTYFVWIQARLTSKSGSESTISVSTDLFPNARFIGTDADSGRSSAAEVLTVVPVGPGRTITFSRNNSSYNYLTMVLCGYMRV